MKKILLVIISLILLTGCGSSSARNEVENYLKQYKNLSSDVLVDLESVIDRENLAKEQENTYRDILKKQYKDLSYEIVEEEYDNDLSYVTVKVTVYDLYKVQSDANTYLENNQDEFNNDEGIYNEEKYIDYKLNKMKDTTDRIEYTIVFTVTKEDDKYVVTQPSEDDLLKIHGIYNYELS